MSNPVVRLQKTWMWIAVAGMVLMGAGIFGIAGFLPPHAPSASAAEIAQIYRDHASRIRFGLTLSLLGNGLGYVLPIIICVQLRRIEKRMGEPAIMSLIQGMVGTIGNFTAGTLPITIWIVAAFRPERSDELLLLLNDMGWLTFVWVSVPPFFAQIVAMVFGIMRDNSRRPLFPRWFGWMSIANLGLALPASLILWFKTGPFAWNGIIAWWIPLIFASLWSIAMIVATFKAVGRTDYDQAGA